MTENIHREDAITRRIQAMKARVDSIRDAGMYFYNQPVSELLGVLGCL
jgi:hypothetical protein